MKDNQVIIGNKHNDEGTYRNLEHVECRVWYGEPCMTILDYDSPLSKVKVNYRIG